MSKLLIVNADDFGISEGVNRAIVEAHRAGILTSATLMANLRAFDNAVEATRDNPTLGVGVHLNLTAGAPVLPRSSIPTLVDRAGRFCGGATTLSRLSLRRLSPIELEAEMSAQVERVLEAGIIPTHIDSHHHLHLHPTLQPIALRVVSRFRIPAIRSTVETGIGGAARAAGMLVRNGSGPPAHLSGGRLGERRTGRTSSRESARGVYLKTVALSALGAILRARARRAGIATPDHFRGLLLGIAFSSAELQATLQQVPEGTTELMCHPGYPDGELSEQTSYSSGRDTELRALLEPDNRPLLEKSGTRLGNYSDLLFTR